MEKKWDTVIPADLKGLFLSGTYICPADHERVNYGLVKICTAPDMLSLFELCEKRLHGK